MRDELRALVVLAIPLVGTQLAGVALPWTDALFMARMGESALAGGGLGATILTLSTIATGCLFGALSATVARLRSAGKIDEAHRQLTQARLLALGVGAPLAVAALFAEPALGLLGQRPEVAHDAGLYLSGAAPALIATPLAGVQRHAFAALGRPRIVTLAWLFAVPANAALDAALGFGIGPLPGLGVLGVALATTIVSTTLVVGLEVTLTRIEPGLGRAWSFRPDGDVLRGMLALGAPIAIAVATEVGVFTGAALVVGLYGAAPLAAHQVALQVTQLLFVVPNGIAQAASVRVAAARGASSPGRVHAAVRAALALTATWALGIAVALALARHSVVAVYLGPDREVARALARTLLIVVAGFQLADGLQVATAGALRGLERTRVAMRWGLLAYALVAPLGAGVLLVLLPGSPALDVWAGLAGGLFVAAIALVRRVLLDSSITHGHSVAPP